MLIFPAIDLKGGECVRLLYGDFEKVTRYGDPFEQLQTFAAAGATWTHVVDLDGARAGAPVQHDLIGRLASASSVRIQCGGGVRTRDDVRSLLAAGVERVVVGSVAARRPAEVISWAREFGVERVCAALDVRPAEGAWEVAADGWTASSGIRLNDLLQTFDGALKHVLVTDITRDGALAGVNVELMRSVASAWPRLAFQASGGVATLDDLSAARAAGAAAAIVGRALYQRQFTLEDALAL